MLAGDIELPHDVEVVIRTIPVCHLKPTARSKWRSRLKGPRLSQPVSVRVNGTIITVGNILLDASFSRFTVSRLHGGKCSC